ncbi:unnamed protein product, partial [Phaeothamnion confervicola]
LYNYLNVPFLELKRQTLLRQAQRAGEELAAAARELDATLADHDYRKYLSHLQATRANPAAGEEATL